MNFIDLDSADKVPHSLEKFPDLLEIIWQILFCMVIEDTTFYWEHRLFHNPIIYKYFHKVNL